MHTNVEMPTLRELGDDLLKVSPTRRILTLTLPFFWCAAYMLAASLGLWPVAIGCLVSLSFTTYGSTSHDLVHNALGLPRWLNDVLMSVTELLAIRSGHAYQAAHLHHHARYPNDDDIEAKASRYSFMRSLFEGVLFQFRIYGWALKNAPAKRDWIIADGILCLAWLALAIGTVRYSPIIGVYVALIIVGSWIIPLVTSYLPHDPNGDSELTQTRLFRGVVASIVAVEHLYHLEHHLYPAVPHTNWPELAKRLDPHFERAGIEPIVFWF